jgi:hypothetical protein
MTEEEWYSIPNWRVLLVSLANRTFAERRFLLLSAAFLKSVFSQLQPRYQQSIDSFERLADGTIERDEFRHTIPGFSNPGMLVAEWSTWNEHRTGAVARTALSVALNTLAEESVQASLFRDIFGNPFRPVSFDPSWRTSTAVALAKGMYESREFGAMPILADALQDTGCDNDDVLTHCRDASGLHVRGCWVVDLVLGKS